MKSGIVHCHVTGDRIFVDNNTYRNLMDATEQHYVFQIRADLRSNKDPLDRNDRKHTSEVAALQSSVWELNARVDNFPDNRSEETVAVYNTLMKLTAAPTRTSLDLFASLTLRRSRKALVIELI